MISASRAFNIQVALVALPPAAPGAFPAAARRGIRPADPAACRAEPGSGAARVADPAAPQAAAMASRDPRREQGFAVRSNWRRPWLTSVAVRRPLPGSLRSLEAADRGRQSATRQSGTMLKRDTGPGEKSDARSMCSSLAVPKCDAARATGRNTKGESDAAVRARGYAISRRT